MAGPWEKYQPAGPWSKYSQPEEKPTGLGTDTQNFTAGAGKALADTGRGVALRSAQMLDAAPPSVPWLKIPALMLQAAGMGPGQTEKQIKADISESRKLDKPLMDTKAGFAGNVAGNAALLAPTAAIPGANTTMGGGLTGAITGLIQPALDATETISNVLFGGAGGAAGAYVANKVPQMLAKPAQPQKFAAAQAASKEGYVIPPADLDPGVVSEAASAFAGKIKTAQKASAKNQAVTDRLARQALGLGPDEELTAATLKGIRDRVAQQGYAPIRSAGPVQADMRFMQALDNIAATHQGAAKSFPGIGETGVVDLVTALKQPRFDSGDAVDAIRVLRGKADTAFAKGEKEVGKATKAAADALEDMLDRHLSASGNQGALQAFRDARQMIAKTYSVEKGLNSQTGSVSAAALAKQLEKGRPLSGELRTIAETTQAFPRAMQTLKEAPKELSPLDMLVAGGGAASGNPLLMAWLGRPLVRNAMLSPAVQGRAIAGPSISPVQQLLDNRLSQIMLSPVGTATGLQLAQ